MKIIGFIAPKSGGKDASYEILKKNSIASGKLSFAGPLKELCSEVFGIPMRIFHDPLLKEKPFAEMQNFEDIVLKPVHFRDIKRQCAARLPEMCPDTGDMIYNVDRASISGLENQVMKTPRQLLQIIGTDFIRERIYGEWHMRAAFAPAVISKLKNNGVYCVTDVRFPNEYSFLSSKFGSDFSAFYVERPEAEEKLAEATHASELEVLNIRKLIPDENVIINDKTLKQLEKTLLKLDLKTSVSTISEEDDLRRGRWVSKKAKEKGLS